MYASAVPFEAFKTVDTYIIGAQSDNYVKLGWCWECVDERDTSTMEHDCGRNTPPEGIVHVVKMRTEQSELDLENLPF